MSHIKSTVAIAALAAATLGGSAHAVGFVTSAAPMLAGQNGYVASALYTIGDTLPNGFQAVGIPDGIGAYALDKRTVRIMVNAELSSGGKTYTVNNGTVTMAGSRVSYFDIDKASRAIVGGGIAYKNIYKRDGSLVTSANTIPNFSRFCSSSAFEANSFGGGKGLNDRIYFAGEENGNGTMYALDTATGNYHAVPAMGYASFENAALVDTGSASKVAFLLADDTTGAPQTLYVGTKNPTGDFLDRNGLKNGKLYAWVSASGDTNSATFNGGNGDSRNGRWVELTVKDASKASTSGYDAAGYALAGTLQNEARGKGAFAYARLEDVATNPSDGSLVGFVTTGGANTLAGSADVWGRVYTLKIGFDANGDPISGTTTIVYNGNLDSSRALRSPDNIDWASDTSLLVMEDRSITWTGQPNTADGGIIKVGLDGSTLAAARILRNVSPTGYTDTLPGIGDWESSGILDVSKLFGYQNRGSLFIGDVQAHGINLSGLGLAEGGQIFFLENSAVPEPASWALMIAGFGLVGNTLRRRRQISVVAS